MEKRFTTKIFVCRKVFDGFYRETLIDVKLLPSCDDDDLSISDVTKYWSDLVSRRDVDYPRGLRYRIETSYTRCRSKCSNYLYKTK